MNFLSMELECGEVTICITIAWVHLKSFETISPRRHQNYSRLNVSMHAEAHKLSVREIMQLFDPCNKFCKEEGCLKVLTTKDDKYFFLRKITGTFKNLIDFALNFLKTVFIRSYKK